MVNIWSIFSQITGGGCPLCQSARGRNLPAVQPGALPYNRHPCPRCALPLPGSGAGRDTLRRLPGSHPRIRPGAGPVALPGARRRPGGRVQVPPPTALGTPVGRDPRRAAQQEESGMQLLLPVPMQAQRLRERGFNQAAELARCLSLRLGIPWAADRLFRIRGGDQQQTLKRGQRRRNVRGAFACSGAAARAGRTDRRCDDHGRHGRGGQQGPEGRGWSGSRSGQWPARRGKREC